MKTLFAVLRFPITLVVGLIKSIFKVMAAIFRGLGMLARRGPSRLIGGKSVFNQALFSFLGMLAKSDGRVSELDIAKTEALFKRMRLDLEAKASAKTFFKTGAQVDFDPTDLGRLVNETYAGATVPRYVLMTFLIGFSQSSHGIEVSEKAALDAIARALGLSGAEVDQIIASLNAGEAFRGSASRKSSRDKLEAAYRIIGVSQRATNKELKVAYRKLISINHPDKAIGKNLPEEAVAEANNRMQEIIDAYENICATRGLRH